MHDIHAENAQTQNMENVLDTYTIQGTQKIHRILKVLKILMHVPVIYRMPHKIYKIQECIRHTDTYNT